MATDYSKWDRIAAELDSDQEKEEDETKKQPLLYGGISNAEAEKIQEFRERFTRYQEDCLKNESNLTEIGAIEKQEIETNLKYPKQDVVDFMCAQMMWKPHVDNCFRHQDIIRVLSSSPSLVKQSNRVCKVLYAITKQIAESSEPVPALDIPQIYCGINTLEAARVHDGVVALFEKICTPVGEDMMELRKKYAQQYFAKEYMMAQMFGDDFRKYQDKMKANEEEPRICPDWCVIL